MLRMPTHSRNDRVVDVLDRISRARIFGVANVAVVRGSRLAVDDHILQDRAETDGVVDLGFLLGREIDAFGVAATFNVEDARFAPAMLIVPDEPPPRISGKRGFTGA